MTDKEKGEILLGVLGLIALLLSLAGGAALVVGLWRWALGDCP